MIVLNLKNYRQSIEKSGYFAQIVSEVVEESGVRVVLAPPALSLQKAAEIYQDVFAQHADPFEAGAHTGYILSEAIKNAGGKGSILNHSERRMLKNEIKTTIESLHKMGLESIVCAESPKEAVEFAFFKPKFIAVEPPELIGSGISVSNAKPDVIIKTVNEVQKIDGDIKVLCGAGVSNKEDVLSAAKLGSSGVLLASAFVKAEDPKEFLREFVSVF
ncbi:triose-phosphate isomerase [Candidatus Micrarchaeota archaeon]|nr:triose-phosphate isomerase [Candidatus Micrarchaeota archaeon]